ncbi:MAG: hypothetical protein LC793_05920 [Thermomicrobia bacterium]|nr:hypothetical protein [Thermomicrobia bacterium]
MTMEEAIDEADRILARRVVALALYNAEREREADEVWDEVHNDALALVEEFFGPIVRRQEVA